MTLDLVLLLVLIVFVLSSYRKGLILSLCSLLILVISCLGASVAQEMLTPRVTQQLQPQFTEIIAEQLETQVASSVDSTIADAGNTGITIAGQSVTLNDLIGLLGSFGLDVQAQTTNLSAPIVQSVAAVVASALLQSIVGFGIYMIAFLIIFLLLRTVELGLNTVDRLPVIHTLNHLGGGVVGFLSGAFFLTMLMTVLSQTGLFPEDAFDGPLSGMLYGIVDKLLLSHSG